MRGMARRQRTMWMMVNPEAQIAKDHALRRIKQLADAALKGLSPVFEQMYSAEGRPSIPPERLLKASLLIALYSVRSERLFCEQLGYNLLYRWFLDMEGEEASFEHSSFSANRARLLEQAVAAEFFYAMVEQARELKLLSDEHFTVDGTLIEAWASLKSFKRRGGGAQQPPDDPGNPTVNFHGESRTNTTHESTTDPDALLARKGSGKEAKLCYSAHALMENRHSLLIDFQVEPADGRAERRAAIAMADERLAGRRRITLGGDKGYDTHGFVAACRALNITPHVARNEARPGGSAIDGRTSRHPGYAVSQWIRKRIEESFGWMKTIGGLRKTRYRGRERVQMHAYFVAAAFNLLRIAHLVPALS